MNHTESNFVLLSWLDSRVPIISNASHCHPFLQFLEAASGVTTLILFVAVSQLCLASIQCRTGMRSSLVLAAKASFLCWALATPRC
ncbi:hypothetical protein Bca4012_036935 [Brassica carinata]